MPAVAPQMLPRQAMTKSLRIWVMTHEHGSEQACMHCRWHMLAQRLTSSACFNKPECGKGKVCAHTVVSAWQVPTLTDSPGPQCTSPLMWKGGRCFLTRDC